MRKRMGMAAAYGFLFFLMATFCRGGGHRFSGYANPGFRPWAEAVYLIPYTQLFGVLIGCFIYFRKSRRTVICPLCEKAKYDDGVTECSCGGQFADLVTLKWVDR